MAKARTSRVRSKPINLFYEEPEGDRWVRFDRYPRTVMRRLVRGSRPVGGMKRYFLNLCAGLDGLAVPYAVNDYRRVRRHPREVACIVGKPNVLDKMEWKNPIVFGPAVFSHPCDDPDLPQRLPIQRLLVSCEWMRKMFSAYPGDLVSVWPAGINTHEWQPAPAQLKTADVLVYDKIRWERGRYEPEMIDEILSAIRARNLSSRVVRYGYYKEDEFRAFLACSRSMIFLCEHETEGFAYLQALSSGVPILAWDRGGFWQDPAYYPHKVQYGPVTSVPYWDGRCGLKFENIRDFSARLDEFIDAERAGKFAPRDYILENLTLEKQAARYLDFVSEIERQ